MVRFAQWSSATFKMVSIDALREDVSESHPVRHIWTSLFQTKASPSVASDADNGTNESPEASYCSYWQGLFGLKRYL